ncbi:MAG: membrane dipeptidase [Clostridia bacterium]|nr:membrane dipeptidase [Clostridia bacterium]
MKLFDLHCDTAGECLRQGIPLRDGDQHINLCKGKCLDTWAQCFAVWIPDALRGEAALEYCLRVAENFRREVEANAGIIKQCKTFPEMEAALARGQCAAILTLEGASPLAAPGGLDRLDALGVKLVTLTWNEENEFGFGCQSGSENGLKPEGKALLRALAARGIIADVSHLNRAGFYDALASEAAVVASHSDCERVLLATRRESADRFFSCRRSLNDDQIRALIDRGGLIGLNFCRSFLGDPGDDGMEAVLRHAAHILELGGERTLAIGSDFDGCEIHPALAGVDRMPDLRAFLAAHGFDAPLLDRIFFENAMNFFKIVLQNEKTML